MLTHPQFNPIAFSLGPLDVHWYGLMYLVAFVLFLVLGVIKTKQPHIAKQGWKRSDIEDLLFYGVLGVILGARLGYVFFYQFSDYISRPLEILYVWQGGMSFHGGFIGVLIVISLFAYFKKRNWLDITDLVAPCVPIGLAAGRIGNFINGELWGRVTDSTLPWIMIFPQSPNSLPRHPSQLYQALLEGLLLFIILWVYSKKPRARGAVSALFLIGYGVFRFIVEYFREPDSHLGLQALNVDMMGLLLVLLGVIGIVLAIYPSERIQEFWEAKKARFPLFNPVRFEKITGVAVILWGISRLVLYAHEADRIWSSSQWIGELSRGQLLCIPMIVAGIILYAWAITADKYKWQQIKQEIKEGRRYQWPNEDAAVSKPKE